MHCIAAGCPDHCSEHLDTSWLRIRKLKFFAEPCETYSSSANKMLRNSFDTSQKTHRVSDAKRNFLMLFREIIAVHSKNVIKHIIRTNCIRF
jgi:hypothetical protein